MRNQVLALAACLAVVGCGDGKSGDELLGAGEIDVAEDAVKSDHIAGRYHDRYGGVLTVGGEPKRAQIEGFAYRVAYTFRVAGGSEFKVWARGADGSNLDTVIGLYGPKNLRTGRYPLVQINDDAEGQLSSAIQHRTRRDGIYLLLVTAYEAGTAEVGVTCTGRGSCESPCAVIRLWAPVCGADGVTYGNSQEAACNDVPVVRDGACEPSCNDVSCADGEHCELEEVVCVTEPCYPQPVCVPDDSGPTCDNVRCAAGTHCELVDVVCVRAPCPPQPQCVPDTNACATVLCAPNTTCRVRPDGEPECVPINDGGGCFRTGCSGQLCADRHIATTCEVRPEYACYASATCERQPDGSCGFTPTPELSACLANPPRQ